jgi:hypothetical protein
MRHAPFDRRFHLILNVAVGGSWPGFPHETTAFPQYMVVGWYLFNNSGGGGGGGGGGGAPPPPPPPPPPPIFPYLLRRYVGYVRVYQQEE